MAEPDADQRGERHQHEKAIDRDQQCRRQTLGAGSRIGVIQIAPDRGGITKSAEQDQDAARGGDQKFRHHPGEQGARADAAARLGANAVIDASSTDVVAAVMEMTGGRGVDVVFETSGADEAMTTAIGAVRMGGTIVSLAVWLTPAPCDYMQVLLKELTIVGSKGYNKPDFPEAIAAMGDGRIAGAEEIITTRIGLEDVITGGFEVLAENRSAHVKVLVSP